MPGPAAAGDARPRPTMAMLTMVDFWHPRSGQWTAICSALALGCGARPSPTNKKPAIAALRPRAGDLPARRRHRHPLAWRRARAAGVACTSAAQPPAAPQTAAADDGRHQLCAQPRGPALVSGEVWPRLAAHGLSFHFVGEDGPAHGLKSGDDLVVHGRADAPSTHQGAADLCINLVQHGGGPKIKTVEALARGRPLVACSRLLYPRDGR